MPEELHHPDREDHLLRRISLIIVETPLHGDDTPPAELSEDEPSLVALHGRHRKVRYVGIFDGVANGDVVHEPAETRSQNNTYLRTESGSASVDESGGMLYLFQHIHNLKYISIYIISRQLPAASTNAMQRKYAPERLFARDDILRQQPEEPLFVIVREGNADRYPVEAALQFGRHFFPVAEFHRILSGGDYHRILRKRGKLVRYPPQVAYLIDIMVPEKPLGLQVVTLRQISGERPGIAYTCQQGRISAGLHAAPRHPERAARVPPEPSK